MYNTKSPVGNGINKPVPATYKAGKEIKVSLNHDGGINATASTVNLSAKFKNPNVKQDVPEAGRNQFM